MRPDVEGRRITPSTTTLADDGVDGFFAASDGRDPWRQEEKEAGRRRRLLEVTAGQIILLAALLILVAALGYGGSHGRHRAAAAATVGTPAQAQGLANWVAMMDRCPANPALSLPPKSFSAPAQVLSPGLSYTATVYTTVGVFRIALEPNLAPHTVNSFVFLADAGYFNCNTFERVIPGEVDLTGNPTGKGVASPGYTLVAEKPPLARNPLDQYPVGSVALANTGEFDGGGSEWFVVTGARGAALPDDYSLFGRITSGMNVVQKINGQGTASGTPTVTERVLAVSIGSAPLP